MDGHGAVQEEAARARLALVDRETGTLELHGVPWLAYLVAPIAAVRRVLVTSGEDASVFVDFIDRPRVMVCMAPHAAEAEALGQRLAAAMDVALDRG